MKLSPDDTKIVPDIICDFCLENNSTNSVIIQGAYCAGICFDCLVRGLDLVIADIRNAVKRGE